MDSANRIPMTTKIILAVSGIVSVTTFVLFVTGVVGVLVLVTVGNLSTSIFGSTAGFAMYRRYGSLTL